MIYAMKSIFIGGLISCENNHAGTFVDLTFKGINKSVSPKKSMALENPIFDKARLVIEKIELKNFEIAQDMEE